MSVATSAEENLKHVPPRHAKLLGATVRGVGLVVAVEANLHPNSYALLVGDDGVRRRVRLAEFRREDATFPLEPQPYVTRTERVDYGVYDTVMALEPAPAPLAAPPAAAGRYLGAPTPFGVIVGVVGGVYNAEATVRAGDGSTTAYRLAFLLAHGARPVEAVAA